MKKRRGLLIVWLLFVLQTSLVFGQQIFKVPLGSPSVTLKWDFLIADETKLDDFQLQRTTFDFGSVTTGPYPVVVATISKASREYVFQIPGGIEVGRKSYFVMVSRKAGAANSVPSNIVGIEIIAPTAPLPPPTNVRIE